VSDPKEHYIKGFGISGFLSFTRFQTFGPFTKVNFFAGQNNAGKSTALKFLHGSYSRLFEVAPIVRPLGGLVKLWWLGVGKV
jgi:predicted ATPase